jgi:hypothetical protein
MTRKILFFLYLLDEGKENRIPGYLTELRRLSMRTVSGSLNINAVIGYQFFIKNKTEKKFRIESHSGNKGQSSYLLFLLYSIMKTQENHLFIMLHIPSD